jgi:hypothetical protein
MFLADSLHFSFSYRCSRFHKIFASLTFFKQRAEKGQFQSAPLASSRTKGTLENIAGYFHICCSKLGIANLAIIFSSTQPLFEVRIVRHGQKVKTELCQITRLTGHQ